MKKLSILLAKGRIYESVYELLSDVGISLKLPDRTYFPITNILKIYQKYSLNHTKILNNKESNLSSKPNSTNNSSIIILPPSHKG